MAPPVAVAAVSACSSTLGEQDLDLILQVEDHNLDLELEEDILDNTTKINSLNKCFSLRNTFRTRRTSKPRRNEGCGCCNIKSHNSNDFMKANKL